MDGYRSDCFAEGLCFSQVSEEGNSNPERGDNDNFPIINTMITKKKRGGGGGRLALLVVCWARCPAWCSVAGSNLLWDSSRRIFSLELAWFLTPFPKNSLKYKPRSSLHMCIPSHRLKRPCHSCFRWVNASNKNTHCMHCPQKWNVNTSMVGLKTVAYPKISPKMVNPRYIAGSAEEDH